MFNEQNTQIIEVDTNFIETLLNGTIHLRNGERVELVVEEISEEYKVPKDVGNKILSEFMMNRVQFKLEQLYNTKEI